MASEVIAITHFEERHRATCASLIQRLPDWFGIEASNRAYIAALGRLPTFVVESGRRVAAFMALEETSPEAVEIHVIAVAPELHRSGIGRAMLSHAEGWARSRGLSILHVKTLAPSHPDPYYARTRAFYHALGFCPVFETTVLWGAENPTVILVKFISAVPQAARYPLLHAAGFALSVLRRRLLGRRRQQGERGSMYVEVDGVRLFFDVEGAKLVAPRCERNPLCCFSMVAPALTTRVSSPPFPVFRTSLR